MRCKYAVFSLIFITLSLASYPPFDLGWLAFAAYVPLLALLHDGVSLRFYLATLGIFNILYFFWLAPVNTGGWLLLTGLFTLGGLPGFFLARYCLRRGRLVFLNFWLVGFEYARISGSYALPFQIIGYTQWNMQPVLLLARWGGVWLVSLFVYFVNLSLFCGIYKKRYPYFGLWISIWLILLAAANYPRDLQTDNSIRVALIQTNLRLADHTEKTAELFWQTYAGACRAAAVQKPDIYIWPETALLQPLRADRSAARRLRQLLAELNAGIILGNRDARDFTPRLENNYNAVFYIDKEGVVRGAHYKQKLVPLLETLNYGLPDFIWRNIRSGAYRRGEDYDLLPIAPQLRVAAIICYEAASGAYVRKFTAQKPGFIVNVSSDGWSRSLTEHKLNFYFNIFRAVENGLYLARVAEDGISAVISPQGEILASLPAFTSGNIVFDVPY